MPRTFAELNSEPSAGANATLTDLTTATRGILGAWRPLHFAHLNLTVPAAGVYGGHYSVTEDELITVASVAGLKQNFIYLDPADYAISGYTMKLRLILSWSQNDTAMGSDTMTAGLYPYLGASATTAWTATVGTVVTGSTAALALAAATANSEGRVVSSTFTAPAANAYILAVDVAGASPAGSTRLNTRLEYSYA